MQNASPCRIPAAPPMLQEKWYQREGWRITISLAAVLAFLALVYAFFTWPIAICKAIVCVVLGTLALCFIGVAIRAIFEGVHDALGGNSRDGSR